MSGLDRTPDERGRLENGVDHDELDVPYLMRYRVGPADGDAR